MGPGSNSQPLVLLRDVMSLLVLFASFSRSRGLVCSVLLWHSPVIISFTENSLLQIRSINKWSFVDAVFGD